MRFKKLTAVFTAALFLLCSINILPVQEKLYPDTLKAAALDFSEYADQVVALVNQEREKQGLSPLYCSSTLNEISQLRAEELEISYSHTRPDGSVCYTALDGVVSYMGYAENIAKNQASPEGAMQDWMNSEGHRANILDSTFEYIGVGVHRDSSGRYYWVQTFISGSDLSDTYLPELKDPSTDPEPTTEPAQTGGTVRFSYSGLDLKKNDKLYLNIAGDPGDTVQIYFYYTDEEGNQQANIIGAFGWTTLDENGKLTESFTAPCDVDYLYGKVVYEKSEPELSYRLEKSQTEEPEETTIPATTTSTMATTKTSTTTTTKTSTAMTTTSTMMTTTATTTTTMASLQVSESEITLHPGEQYTIEANQGNLTYDSSDKDIAIVSKSGVITAMNPGTARITVYNADYDAAVIQVTVSEESSAMYGDANEDGKIDILDVVMMNRVYVGIEIISKQGKINADIDRDEKITLSDSMNVLRFLVHLIDKL